MAVSKLTKAQKELVRINYTSKRMTIVEMARSLDVSPRTIGRVLEELDLASPVQRIKGEAYNVMQTLKKHDVAIDKLDGLLSVLKHGPTEVEVIKYLMELDEDQWTQVLNKVVTARVARNSNVHVQSAMLRIQEQVNRNDRDNKQRK